MTVLERIQARLKSVSDVTQTDIFTWVTEAEIESGLTEDENANAIFYLALALAYEAITTDAARFFSYKDGEESVDKTKIFDNYKELAVDARKQYRKYRRGRGATQSFAKRADGR